MKLRDIFDIASPDEKEEFFWGLTDEEQQLVMGLAFEQRIMGSKTLEEARERWTRERREA